MTDRFKRSYDALCDAFFKGTLAKGTCLACACGNIVAAAVNYKFDKLPEDDNKHGEMIQKMPHWWINRNFDLNNNRFYPRSEVDKTIEDLTGYSALEMCEIETAFEGTCKISYGFYPLKSEQEVLEDQYNGLCAVFEVLCKLDGVEVDYKERLSTHPKLEMA